jgi:hypothetical protein
MGEETQRWPNPRDRVKGDIEPAILALALENGTLAKSGFRRGCSSVAWRSRLPPFVASGHGTGWRRSRSSCGPKSPRSQPRAAILTETQLQAPERAQGEKQARGGIETEHPDIWVFRRRST